MVNLQDTPSAGRITAADLEATRQHSTGRIHLVPAGCGQQRWPERRANFVDTVPVQPAEACTEIGAESMLRYRRTAATVRAGIALALLLAVAGYIAQTVWPLA